MIRAGFVVLLLLASAPVWSQYFQYSQYNFTQQRINPAMVGLTRYATASLNYRNQKTGGDFAINSNFLSLTYPLLNSSTGRPWSGVGIALHNDQSAGIFNTQEVSLSYAIHVHLSRYQTLSLGAKGLYQLRKISLDGFYTGSQYVPDRGFDPNFSSGENFAELRNNFRTFSTGIYWHEVDKKGRLLHHVSFSLFDFNKPADSFLGNPTQLSSTIVFAGGVQAYSKNATHIFPEALITHSAANTMMNLGVRLQRELNIKAKKPSDRVEVFTKYAIGRSGIVGLQFHKENFSFGLSYDFPVIKTNAGNLGAFEIGLELRKLVATRAQKEVARRKKAAEEKKQLQSKNQKPATSPAKQEKEILPTQTDTTVATIPAVEVERPSTPEQATPSALETSATAGKLKQEPLIIERVTLHFAFEFNSSDLDEPTEAFLQELTSTLKENENLKLTITGHTDNIGSDKFNLRLSQKRAEAVKHHLIKMGIDPTRMITEGKGMHQPLNSNLTDADRAKNRRVEITIYY